MQNDEWVNIAWLNAAWQENLNMENTQAWLFALHAKISS